MAALNRVDLAMSIVKLQPHPANLLKCANMHAIAVLKRSLREASQARALEDAQPQPSFLERSMGYRHRLANVAACLAIVVLTRTGLFSSLQRVTRRGQEFMKQYYTTQVGEDLAGEVFGV
ncbi:MAG: hypothetical protein JW993_03945 [Sedimentisphaerales bacterium]|nr:hypothetical protein [Sedimentisphaerales bacterium]